MSTTPHLIGKVCLITGASYGIGSAIAEEYAKHGATLVLVARSQEKLEQIAARCGEKGSPVCEICPTDLLDAAAVDKLCESMLKKYGAVDVLVNNAGIAVGGNALEGDPDEWSRMMTLNQLVPMQLTRKLSPAMAERQSGVIINIGSIAGVEPMTGGAYSASKWALRGWTKSCYQVLRHKNIKVMLINPAYVNTPMVGGNPQLYYDRMIQPSDIAEVAMLPFTLSRGCVPEEVTLRLSLSAYKT